MLVRNDDLSLINRDGDRVVEPGEFLLASSRRWSGRRRFELVGPDGARGPKSEPTTRPVKTGADE